MLYAIVVKLRMYSFYDPSFDFTRRAARDSAQEPLNLCRRPTMY